MHNRLEIRENEPRRNGPKSLKIGNACAVNATVPVKGNVKSAVDGFGFSGCEKSVAGFSDSFPFFCR